MEHFADKKQAYAVAVDLRGEEGTEEFFAASGSMPGPLSVTVRVAGEADVATVISPLEPILSAEFFTILIITCSISTVSVITGIGCASSRNSILCHVVRRGFRASPASFLSDCSDQSA